MFAGQGFFDTPLPCFQSPVLTEALLPAIYGDSHPDHWAQAASLIPAHLPLGSFAYDIQVMQEPH
ncbi:MAG: hypothetical protein ACKO5C_04230 [Ferruginibacter sp.]